MTNRLGIIVAIAGGVVVLVLGVLRLLYNCTQLASRLLRIAKLLSLMPKVKLILAFTQSVTVLPTVYNVRLPSIYYEWTSHLNIFQIDWLQFAVPGCASECTQPRTSHAL